MVLTELYAEPDRALVAAHRGWSGRYPENTISAFLAAVEIGADLVEFDVRQSSDGEFVVIHDATLDRTTDGTGPVRNRSLAELKRLNATFWQGPHDAGRRRASAFARESIPTLTETFEALAGRVGLNVQIYTEGYEALDRMVGLFADYALHDSAFLMLNSFDEVDHVRNMDPRVLVCTGEDRANIDRQLEHRMDFLQPAFADVTGSYARRAREAGARVNVFYANTTDRALALLDAGIRGILTDCPDTVIAAARTRGLRHG